MLENFIITFRETLETALIVGIILSYLVKIKQTKYNNIVYVGIAGGIMASILGALLFIGIAGEFEGKAEQIFEGTTMLIGAVLLATMILWMMNQKYVAGKLQTRLDSKLDETRR
ncbi:FTR1 family protein, partial [Candidatus Peregrinibacteria bacterium]|nr:FTR1 family protein [Candidatus Peregrinibacteria bacterium]